MLETLCKLLTNRQWVLVNEILEMLPAYVHR
jgi:hypothetical protein